MKAESQFTSADLKWVYHNKIAYYPLQKTQLNVSDKTQHGDWNDIAKIYPSQKESGGIFNIDAEHGRKPQHQSYAYAILPSITLNAIKRYKPSFTVIENSSAAQVVSSNNNKVFMFVIYQPARFTIAHLGAIHFEQAGLYMFEQTGKKWFLTASDPTHKLNQLSFNLSGKKYNIDLPQKSDLGKSVTKPLD